MRAAKKMKEALVVIVKCVEAHLSKAYDSHDTSLLGVCSQLMRTLVPVGGSPMENKALALQTVLEWVEAAVGVQMRMEGPKGLLVKDKRFLPLLSWAKGATKEWSILVACGTAMSQA